MKLFLFCEKLISLWNRKLLDDVNEIIHTASVIRTHVVCPLILHCDENLGVSLQKYIEWVPRRALSLRGVAGRALNTPVSI